MKQTSTLLNSLQDTEVMCWHSKFNKETESRKSFLAPAVKLWKALPVFVRVSSTMWFLSQTNFTTSTEHQYLTIFFQILRPELPSMM